MRQCSWPGQNQVLRDYHDNEWCVPSFDDRCLFELLSLEGAQAGLSWSLILARREEYRRAFHHFDIARCACLTEKEIADIARDYGVVKNMAKLRSVKSNAVVILRLQEEFGSFADFLWRFVDFKPIVNAWESEALVPAKNALSERVSRELKKRGIKFAGPVIVYSFLQAAGIIDDHIRSCPRQKANRNDC